MHSSFDRIVRCLLVCVAITACDTSSLQAGTDWPGRQAQDAFDFRPIEAATAIRAIDQMAFFYPASTDCHFDFQSDAAFAKFQGLAGETMGAAIGDAAWNIILAEIERLHPGGPDNRSIAERLMRRRMEAKAREGYAAFKASNCAALRPGARNALIDADELSLKLGARGGWPGADRR